MVTYAMVTYYNLLGDLYPPTDFEKIICQLMVKSCHLILVNCLHVGILLKINVTRILGHDRIDLKWVESITQTRLCNIL